MSGRDTPTLFTRSNYFPSDIDKFLISFFRADEWFLPFSQSPPYPFCPLFDSLPDFRRFCLGHPILFLSADVTVQEAAVSGSSRGYMRGSFSALP